MFTVRWDRAALEELATIWMQATDRADVNAAVAAIDSLLASAPESAGESRGGDRRILFATPLTGYFEVDATSRIVFVLTVKRMRRS